MENELGRIPIIEELGYDEEGVIKPSIILDDGVKLPKHIDTALLLFDNQMDKALLNDSKVLYNFVAASSILTQYIYKNKIVLAYAPLGGPAAGGLIEELISLGIKRIIACGSAGTVQDIDKSKLLIVNKAIRDEGLSYHYLKASTYVESNQDLIKEIKVELDKMNINFLQGISWTTDAFFRETKSRINKRVKQGAMAVEMENASMAAVAIYRHVQFAQVLYFSDIVHNNKWSGFHFNRKQIKEMVHKAMIEVVLNIL